MPKIHAPSVSPADVFIAQLLSGGRIATARQIDHMMVRYHGYSRRNTAGRLAHLQRCGLLRSAPIHSWAGRTSQRAYALTETGASLTKASDCWVDLDRVRLDGIQQGCQLTENSIWMRENGWIQVCAADLPEALRAWALARYRGRALTSSEQWDRQLLQRAALPPLKCGGLKHVASGEVRILWEVRLDVYVRSQLRRLEEYRLLDPLDIQLVGWDETRVRAAQRKIAQWATARRRVRGHRRAGRGRQIATHYSGTFTARAPVREP